MALLPPRPEVRGTSGPRGAKPAGGGLLAMELRDLPMG